MPLKILYRCRSGKLYSRKPKGGKIVSLYIHGTHRGQRVRVSAGSLELAIAERLLAKIKQDIDAERDQLPGRKNLAYAIARYIEASGNDRFLQPVLQDEIAQYRLKDLTGDAIQAAAERILPGRKTATKVRQVYTPIIAAYNHVVSLHIASERSISRPAIPKKDRPVLEYARGDYLPRLRQVLSPVEDACVLFLTLTGERTSATADLTWDKVDLERRRVELMTKTGPQSIALHPDLHNALLAIWTPASSGRVFGYTTRWGISQMLERRQKQAGLPRLAPHKIGRHTFASRILNAGGSVKDVQIAGRWKSSQLVMETYGHLEQSRVDEIVTKAPLERFSDNNLTQPLKLALRASASKTRKSSEITQLSAGAADAN